ncbi:unnamed protein product [Microthlaspi erraticum]|uniref:Uncharacterized protein n=1 Tax=Microthlaspi erraticum TaxID=1685480 RepID=A0A6D2I3Z0_9BRAS|nr:unnamed protein product [Microthlaspi erraticum]
MTKTVDEAKVLIENLAASDCNNCPDYDRSSRTTTSSPDSFQMTELKNMMAQVLKGQLKHINAIEGMSDANEDSSRECMGDFSNEANEEDVNYIGNYGNKGYNPSYRPNPNMSIETPMWRILKTKCILQGIHNNKDLLTNLKEVNFSQGKDMSRDHHIRPRSHMLLHQIKLLQTNKVGDLKESSNRSWMARRETLKRCMRRWTLCSAISTPSMMLLPLM